MFESGYSNREGKLHGNFYDPEMDEEDERDSMLDRDVQLTLDPLRSISVFQDDIQRISEEISELDYEDAEVSFAYFFGSPMYGMTMLPDAAVNQYDDKEHLKSKSDLDAAIMIDANIDNKEFFGLFNEVNDVIEELDSETVADRDYWIWQQGDFVEGLRDAINDWTDEKRGEFLVVPERNREREDQEANLKLLPKYARSLWSGYFFPERFVDEDLEGRIKELDITDNEEVEEADLPTLLGGLAEYMEDEEGRLREPLEDENLADWFKSKFDNENSRVNALNQNFRLGTDIRALNRSSYPTEDYLLDDGRINKTSLMTDIFRDILSDEEIADMIEGTVMDAEINYDRKEDLSTWVDDLDDPDYEEAVGRFIRERLLEHPDIEERREGDIEGYRMGGLKMNGAEHRPEEKNIETSMLQYIFPELVKELYSDLQLEESLTEYTFGEMVDLDEGDEDPQMDQYHDITEY